MVKVAAVFGLSGVGKSWMVSRFATNQPVTHVQASQLLRNAEGDRLGKAVTQEELRTGAVLDNQTLLTEAFSKLLVRATRPIIFDGHCLIDSGDRLVEIRVEVIKALSPSGIIFVRGDPYEISARRKADLHRLRPSRSEAELQQQQERSIELCMGYARNLSVTLAVVPTGDEQKFACVVSGNLGF